VPAIISALGLPARSRLVLRKADGTEIDPRTPLAFAGLAADDRLIVEVAPRRWGPLARPGAGQPTAPAARYGGRRILPAYLVIDTSQSMEAVIGTLNAQLADLWSEVLHEPKVAATCHLAVITFDFTAVVRTPLASVATRQPAELSAARTAGSRYYDAFTLLRATIANDVYQLHLAGCRRPYQPVAFFLSDGTNEGPDGKSEGSQDWTAALRELTDWGAFFAVPKLIAFGFGTAREDQLRLIGGDDTYLPGSGVLAEVAIKEFTATVLRSMVDSSFYGEQADGEIFRIAAPDPRVWLRSGDAEPAAQPDEDAGSAPPAWRALAPGRASRSDVPQDSAVPGLPVPPGTGPVSVFGAGIIDHAVLRKGPGLGRKGATGAVYELEGTPGYCFKEYLRPLGPGQERRLDALVSWRNGLSETERAGLDAYCAWPLARAVRDGVTTGVVMLTAPAPFWAMADGRRRVRELQHLIYPREARDLGLPEVGRASRLATLGSLAAVMAFLDAHQMVYGDIGDKNVLWTPDDGGRVFLLDCDNARPVALAADPGITMPPADWRDPALAEGMPPGIASDRYALGVCYYKVFCGVEQVPERPEVPRDVPVLADLEWLVEASVFGPASDRPPAGTWTRAIAGIPALAVG
jgi:uncharacterized protein YegL